MNKEFFEKNSINTIKDFFFFCQKEFNYGWLDRDGKRHLGVNDAESYYLQSPKELIENKIGICWDMTELYRAFFDIMTDLKIETYYIFYDDGKGCPSHSILVFYKNNKVYWFEPMFQSKYNYYSNIHEYDTIDDLLIDLKKIWLRELKIKKIIPENYQDENIFIYKYDIPKYHINGFEMRNHIDSSKLINIIKRG